MTCKCIDCLIDEAIYESNQLKRYRVLVSIAVEQLDLEVPDAMERVEILLENYLSSFDCYFENLEHALRRLNNLSLPVAACSDQQLESSDHT